MGAGGTGAGNTGAGVSGEQRPLDVVILAAGQGTRMRSRLSKLLHPVLGRPMVGWSVRAAQGLGARDIVVVTGHEAEQVEAALSASGVRFVRQAQRLGTGHAFLTAARTLRGGADILLLYGDSPMLRLETLREMVQAHRREATNISILTSELEDATGYGRIIRGPGGGVLRIVEEKAATPQERAIREFNSGVYVMDPQAPALAEHIGHDNPAGEYYITDLVGLYSREGARVVAFFTPDAGEVMGANDRAQLSQLEAMMRRRVNERHMLSGVTLQDPPSTVIEDTVQIGQDVTLEPGVMLRGATVLGEGVTVGAYSVLSDSRLEPGVTVKAHSVLEGAEVGAGSDVGPFARLRPGTVLGEGVHIGNFVETKNAQLAAGVKAGHLAYLGDVTVGQETNIGAGTIIANFDGLNKHQSRVGAGAFIGSNSTIIAPRVLGDAAFVAAGSTIGEDVPEGALSVARGRQRNLSGWSERYWRGLGARVAEKLPWLGGWLAGRQEQAQPQEQTQPQEQEGREQVER